MNGLKEKMGSRALAVPFAIGLAMLCVLGLAIAPMFSASPRNVPMAVVNLDEGAQLSSGDTMNAGAALAETLAAAADAAGEDGEAPIAWTELDSRDALDAALDAGEFYGAVVIPADFTARQMAGQTAAAEALQDGMATLAASQAQAAAAPADQAQAMQAQAVQGVVAAVAQAQESADKPTVEIVLDLAKSPMLAQTMQSSLSVQMAAAGLQADIETIGSAEGGDGPLASMMSVQFMVMPLFMMSIVMGVLCVVLVWPGRAASRAEKVRAVARQALYCIVASLVAAVAAYGIVAWIGGVSVDASAVLLLWLSSFCLMCAMAGLGDIALPLGALTMLALFALGMATAILPAPMLPDFWANCVLPWAPQACIGDNLRGVIYLGAGAFDAGVWQVLVWLGVGALAFAVAVLAGGADKKEAAA